MTILTRDQFVKEMMESIEKLVESDIADGSITDKNRKSQTLLYMSFLGGTMRSPVTESVYRESKRLRKKEDKKVKK